MLRLTVMALAVLALSGCVKPSMYNWSEYESMLYEGYKNPAKMEEMKIGLEAGISATEKSGQKVPPGLYAELGTLYLQSGSSDKAVAMYARERNAWPESRGLMDQMIQNIERRESIKAGATK